MKTLLIAIHGILTRQTDPSWPDRLDAWLCAQAPEVRVLKKEYHAGPWPRWNCLIKNPHLAVGLTHEIQLLLKSAPQSGERPSLWIVAHSNGALIALSTIRRLLSEDQHVDGLILIGAACTADIRRNGILDWVRSGKLGWAVAYCSVEDHTLPGTRSGFCGRVVSGIYRLLAWPYGALGQTGWMLDGARVPEGRGIGTRLITRWFGGGHSGYFAPEQLEFTFQQILHDIHSPRPAVPYSRDFIHEQR